MTGLVTVRRQKVRKPRRRHKLTCLLILAAALLLALLFIERLCPYDPNAQVFAALEPPSAAHPAGTDRLGRDLLSPHPDRPADQRAVLAGSGSGHCRGRQRRRRAERLLWRLGRQHADADRRRLSGVSRSGARACGRGAAGRRAAQCHARAGGRQLAQIRPRRPQPDACAPAHRSYGGRRGWRAAALRSSFCGISCPTARGRCLSPRCWISAP